MKILRFIALILAILLFLYALILKLQIFHLYFSNKIPTPGTLLDTSGILCLFAITFSLFEIIKKMKDK